MDPRLFNAAFNGDVNALLALIQEDPLILFTVTVTTSNTPLHIAALLGHTEFAMVVMQYCPQFATEFNYQGLTPIHLASANGHSEIVREMRVLWPDLVGTKDEDGKSSLHTAATRGRVQVVRELFSPESALDLTPSGETAIHLAVKHNQFKALETLIQLANQYQVGNELFNAKDEDGNTMLHLACVGKNSKIVKLLVPDQTPIEVINAVNSEGLTALDIAKRISMVGNSKDEDEIHEALRRAGAETSGRAEQTVVANPLQQGLARADSLSLSLRNGFGVVAALFATLSFELAMNPPGGAWQDWASGTNQQNTTQADAAGKVTHMPGISIIWELHKSDSLGFLRANASCFFISLILLGVLAITEYRQTRRLDILVLSLFGSLLIYASFEFTYGMALVTRKDFAYISYNICRYAWIQIISSTAISFFLLFCLWRIKFFLFGRKSQQLDKATGGGEEGI